MESKSSPVETQTEGKDNIRCPSIATEQLQCYMALILHAPELYVRFENHSLQTCALILCFDDAGGERWLARRISCRCSFV